ncbi:MAG: hypothetical protein ACI80I_003422, partial [Akkermansiaceae bacterium]
RRQALPRTAYGQLHMMQMNQLCRNDSDTGGAVFRDQVVKNYTTLCVLTLYNGCFDSRTGRISHCERSANILKYFVF